MASQREVARALGVSRPLVQAIEQRAIAKLAEALGEEPRPLTAYHARLSTPKGPQPAPLRGVQTVTTPYHKSTRSAR